jgi:hypothetical protein
LRSSTPDLKALRITVAGTRHEGRPALLRTLRVGSQVSLSRREKNPHDENAVAVMYRKRQLGWIPRTANLAVLGLKIDKGTIVEVGTDDGGGWTHLVVEFFYEPTTAVGKLVSEHGAVVASVLKQMHVPDLKVARSIAQLPTTEQHDAVTEWNEMQTAPPERDKEEPADETQGPRQGGRRRRSAS